ncbi:hypothetical protein [Paraglaciecola aestuariivivens]
MSETGTAEKLKNYLTLAVLVLTVFCILSSVVHNSIVTSWFGINFLAIADLDDYFKLGIEAFTHMLILLIVTLVGLYLIFWACFGTFEIMLGPRQQAPDKVAERNKKFKRFFALPITTFAVLAYFLVTTIAGNATSYIFDNKNTRLHGSEALAFIGLKHGVSEINFGKNELNKDCMIHIIELANNRYFWSLKDNKVFAYSETYLNSVQQQFPPPNLGNEVIFEPPARQYNRDNLEQWTSKIEKHCS